MNYYTWTTPRRVVNGRLERRPGSISPVGRISGIRPVVVAALIVGLICTITNPSNKLLPRAAFDSQVRSMMSDSNKWLRAFQTHTNYLLFTLTSDLDGVHLSTFLRSFYICDFAATSSGNDYFLVLQEDVCRYVADNLCHGKPLWPGGGKDLPISVFRILIVMQLLVWVGGGDYLLPRIRRHPMLYWPLSVLDVGESLLDLLVALLQWSLLVFPAMECLHRLLKTYLYEKERMGLYFVSSLFLLLFGMGGLANYLGSSVRQQQLHYYQTITTTTRNIGIDGAVAACMGYQVAINRSFSYNWLGASSRISPSIVTLFWMRVGFYVLVDQRNMGALVAFCVAGMLGHFFGLAQRDWLYEHLVESWRMAGQRFVDNLFGGKL